MTKEIPVIDADASSTTKKHIDQNGFFLIKLIESKISVEYYANVIRNNKVVSGKLQMIFTGSDAERVSNAIEHHVPELRKDHYMYLGRELMKAELALKTNTRYEQDS
jgi:dihydropteroate synthase